MDISPEMNDKIKEILSSSPMGATITDISRGLNLNRNSTSKYLGVLAAAGEIEMDTIGPSKIYRLSHRAPVTSLLEFTYHVVVMMDSKFNIIYVNKKYYEFFNDPEYYKNSGNGPDVFVKSPNYQQINNNIREALKGAEKRGYLEFQKDGRIIYFRYKAIPTIFNDGHRGVTIIIEDITEQKLLEVSIEKKNHLIGELLESIADGFLSLDREWRFTYLNKYAAENLHLKSEDIIGKIVYEEFPLVIGTVQESICRKVMETREVQRFETKGFITDRWYHVTVSPSDDGISILWQDVTKNKQDEAAIKQKEILLDAFFDNTQGILNIRDDELRFLKTDRLTPVFYNLDRNSIIGKSLKDLSPENMETYGPIIRQVLETGEPAFNVEVKNHIPSKPDETVYLLVTYFRIPMPDGSWGIGTVGLDITERKQAEKMNQSINYINGLITSSRDFTGIMHQVLAIASRAIGCDSAAIALLQEDRYIVNSAYGFPDALIGRSLPVSDMPHANLAIDTKKPLIINDALNDVRTNHEHMKIWSINSLMILPMIARDQAVGIIFFNYQKQKVNFMSRHVDFAEQLASSISLALGNENSLVQMRAEIDTRKLREKGLQEQKAQLEALVLEQTRQLEDARAIIEKDPDIKRSSE